MTERFAAEQRRTLAGMVIALVVTGIALRLGPRLFAPELPNAGERLAYAACADLFLAIPLALAIGNVARLRFFSATDIAGSAFATPTRPIAVAGALLQNTLEQTILAVPAHLALAVLLPLSWIGVLPVLVVLFLLGRLCFALGYKHGASARAFGFALTFYPTLIAIGWALVLFAA